MNNNVEFKLLNIEDPAFRYMTPRMALIEALNECWEEADYTPQKINEAVAAYTPMKMRQKKGSGVFPKETIAFFEEYIQKARENQLQNGGVILFQPTNGKEWKAIAAEHGIDLDVAWPKREYKYFAYKGGEAKEFESREEAARFSTIIETVQTNEAEIKKHEIEYNRRYSMVFEVWYKGLRSDYADLNDEIFAKCYSKAYEDGHSSGHDNVANELDYIADFARDVIKAHEMGKAKELGTPEDSTAESTKGKRKPR